MQDVALTICNQEKKRTRLTNYHEIALKPTNPTEAKGKLTFDIIILQCCAAVSGFFHLGSVSFLGYNTSA